MKFEKEAAGTAIKQLDSEIIKVTEGGGCARPFGIIALIGGIILIGSTARILDLTFIMGVFLALFGAAIATQRFSMTLNRLKGTWSCGGDFFFLISFKSRGLLQEVGTVRISKRSTNPSEHNRGEPIITYPVSVAAKKIGGGETELRFGQDWSLEEAYEISSWIAEFLGREVQDDSEKKE